MDPVTHTIAGAAAAVLVTPPSAGLDLIVTVAAGVIASVTPDIDFATKYLSQASFLKHHHGITHGLASAVIQGALVALLFALIFGMQHYLTLLLACLAAEATHLILDMLLHSNGIALFSPFSERRFSFPILLGINPMTALAACHKQNLPVCLVCQLNSAIRNPLPLALILAVVASLIDFPNMRYYAAACFVFIAVWYLLSALARVIAHRKLRRLPQWRDWELLGPYPANFYLVKWLGIFRKGDQYATTIVRLGRRGALKEHFYGASGQGRFLEQAKASPMRHTFETAAYVPFEEEMAEPGGYKVRWTDLSHALDPDYELFSVHVHLDPQGSILRSAFRERWNPEVED